MKIRFVIVLLGILIPVTSFAGFPSFDPMNFGVNLFENLQTILSKLETSKQVYTMQATLAKTGSAKASVADIIKDQTKRFNEIKEKTQQYQEAVSAFSEKSKIYAEKVTAIRNAENATDEKDDIKENKDENEDENQEKSLIEYFKENPGNLAKDLEGSAGWQLVKEGKFNENFMPTEKELEKIANNEAKGNNNVGETSNGDSSEGDVSVASSGGDNNVASSGGDVDVASSEENVNIDPESGNTGSSANRGGFGRDVIEKIIDAAEDVAEEIKNNKKSSDADEEVTEEVAEADKTVSVEDGYVVENEAAKLINIKENGDVDSDSKTMKNSIVIKKPTKAVELLKPIKSTKVLKSVKTVEPLKPVKAVELSKPIKSTEVLKSVKTVEPLKPVKAVEPIKPVKTIKTPANSDAVKLKRLPFKSSFGYGKIQNKHQLSFASLSGGKKTGSTAEGILIVPESVSLNCGIDYEDAIKDKQMDKCLREINFIANSESDDDISMVMIQDAGKDIFNGYIEYLASSYFEALDVYNDSLTFKENEIDPIITTTTSDIDASWIIAKEMHIVLGSRFNKLRQLSARKLSMEMYSEYISQKFKKEKEKEK